MSHKVVVYFLVFDVYLIFWVFLEKMDVLLIVDNYLHFLVFLRKNDNSDKNLALVNFLMFF